MHKNNYNTVCEMTLASQVCSLTVFLPLAILFKRKQQKINSICQLVNFFLWLSTIW